MIYFMDYAFENCLDLFVIDVVKDGKEKSFFDVGYVRFWYFVIFFFGSLFRFLVFVYRVFTLF